MSTSAELGARSFDGRLRGYQQHALQAIEDSWARGDRHSYLVLPPGAGTTVVGLEAARRLGRRTLVLVPNHAVLGQWADTWDRAFPAVCAATVTPCGTGRELAGPLTVLIYRSIAVIDENTPAQQRRQAVGGATVGGPGGLRPVLVTGTSSACAASIGDELARFCAAAGYPVSLQPLDGDPDLAEVVGSSAHHP